MMSSQQQQTTHSIYILKLNSRLSHYIPTKWKILIYGYVRGIEKLYGYKCPVQLIGLIVPLILYFKSFPTIAQRVMTVETNKTKSEILTDAMYILANEKGKWSTKIIKHIGPKIYIN